ncbi:phosphomannomutase/phosphoglucomutase [Tahibacter soli]|uniref:phosphomannomutase n=1 Tax=Tahibacter soli TaxID=2983605 RepID=A0A9X3YJ12_9GAMM|nr:phosphomannomutase/phosphoglucomutase [Tahibacter soli]MDC8013147.1 phosphomannomutase/phosphoglucomutase [Tahibacter soli]
MKKTNGAGNGGKAIAAPAQADSAPKAARRLPSVNVDWHRFLPVAAATLLLVTALFCAWQMVQVWLDADARSSLNEQRVRVAQALSERVAESHAKVQAALAAPAVLEALAAGESGRAPALAALRLALPEMADGAFFSPTLTEVMSNDFREFGYAKAAQLIKAQGGSAPVQSIKYGKDARLLSFAEPIKGADGQPLAVAWVALPSGPLLTAFASAADVGLGRLELRQGDGSRGDLVLTGVGSGTERRAYDFDNGYPVEGSAFRVASQPPDLYIAAPDNPWLMLVLTILFGGAGMIALWLRKVGLQAGMAKLTGKLGGAKEDAGSQLTMAETLKQEAKPAPRVADRPAAAKPSPPPAPAQPALAVDRSIFRAYDIRGVVGKTLDRSVARQIGRAIGSEGVERGLREIVVGRDGRLSGPDMAAGLIEGLRQAGMDVIDVGMVPTPLVYYATFHLNTGSGVSVTGSHNPPDYNGFKIVLGGETLAESAIQSLYARIAENRFTSGSGGLQSMDVKADYIDRIAGDVQVDQKLKVVVDCGNGVPGLIVPAVIDAIGCEAMPLYCDVDGEFPNHHPDPSDLHNLRDLILTVKQMNADLGLAFDGDGDRLGVVTKSGEVIFPDRLLMLFAKDVLTRNPGASIIYDVKCTGKLQPEILKHGGSPILWKTGHSLIKAKMRETDAELAGEMSGHFFFKERWYGFDDGIYAAARLLEILAGDLEGRDPQAVFDSLPKGVSTPELKVEMHEGEHYRFMDRFRERASFEGARVTTIDGVRADWPDGWGLVRASNTTPVLVLRFDADSDAALLRIKETYRKQLLAVDANLHLPF